MSLLPLLIISTALVGTVLALYMVMLLAGLLYNQVLRIIRIAVKSDIKAGRI